MNQVDKVLAFHEIWRSKKGADQIATSAFLLQLLQLSPLVKVVDYGAGIGTITSFLTTEMDCEQVIAVEPSIWCQQQFFINVLSSEAKLMASLEGHTIDPGFTWIIDMAFLSGDLKIIMDSDPGLVIIEGHRFHQRECVLREIRKRNLGASYRSFSGGTISNKGGCIIAPKENRTMRDEAVFIQVRMLRTLYDLKHGVVHFFNTLGVGKGAKT
jgi:hypothetical protein